MHKISFGYIWKLEQIFHTQLKLTGSFNHGSAKSTKYQINFSLIYRYILYPVSQKSNTKLKFRNPPHRILSLQQQTLGIVESNPRSTHINTETIKAVRGILI